MSPKVDEHSMRQALKVATSLGSDPASTPTGCVIVRDGRVIGTACNERQTLHDATAHAEMAAFQWMRFYPQLTREIRERKISPGVSWTFSP